MKPIRYTIRDVPSELDRALRERMRNEGLSLNTVLRETLKRGAGLGTQPVINHDFDDLAGQWVRDEACEEVLEDIRATIDRDPWP